MRKFIYNKLIFKLSIPVVLIIIVIFAVLTPYVINLNTSFLEKRVNEHLSHLSSSTVKFVNDELGELQQDLKLLIDIPLFESALRTNNNSELSRLLLPVKLSQKLDFIAAVDHGRNIFSSFHNNDISLENISGLDIIDRGLLGTHLSSIYLLNEKLYAVTVVSSSTRDKPNIIIAGRVLKKPVLEYVEGASEIYHVIFYDLNGKMINMGWDTPEAHEVISSEVVKRVRTFKRPFLIKELHINVPHMMIYGPLAFNHEEKAIYGIHIPAADVLEARDEVARTIFAFMIGALFLLILTGYINSRWVSSRIEKILKGTEEISSGKLGYQLLDRSGDEIGKLAASFNYMSESLLEGQKWWQHTFDSMDDSVSIHDLEGNIMKGNASLRRLLGMSEEELTGKKCYRIFHNKESHINGCPAMKCIVSRKPEKIETFEPEVGRWLSISTAPIFKDGEVINVIHVVRDISERKEFEKNLQESEGRYRSVVETSADMIFITDGKTGKILDINRSASELMGYSKDEIIGTVSGDRIVPFQKDEYKKEFEKLKETGKCSGEFIIRRKDGEEMTVEVSGTVSGNYLFVIAKNITHRKRTEDLIQLQFSRLNVLHSIEKAVNSSLDLRATFDHLVEQVTTQLGIDAAAVLILNRHTQMLEYMVSKGFRSSALKHTRLKFGEGYGGSAAKERRTITVSDLGKEPGAFSNSKDFTTEGFITYFAVPLVAKGEVKGVMELFHRLHMDAEPDWLEFLETIADQVSIAIDNAALFNDLQSSRNELISAYDSTIVGWSHAMDMRDKETEGHSQRVTEITLRIAEDMGMKDEELVHVKWGALLHDIGKMGVPDRILLKPDELTGEEWEIMKCHTDYARDMLQGIDYLKSSIDIPYCHHEKWDGTGYPRGLKGNEIPLAARMFAIADVWDALCSDRPYRPAWPVDKVIEHIRSLSGTHFDPEVAEIFLRMVSAEERKIGRFEARKLGS